jgi:hypothetical protein
MSSIIPRVIYYFQKNTSLSPPIPLKMEQIRISTVYPNGILKGDIIEWNDIQYYIHEVVIKNGIYVCIHDPSQSCPNSRPIGKQKISIILVTKS